MKPLPIIEIFGPVVQGEGPLAGQVTHFVRLGLCDYRCSWCDSMYAVEPKLVKLNATSLAPDVILERLSELGPAPWVTLSGGNPAIHDLEQLVNGIQNDLGMSVAVETQGSLWRDWLVDVDMLIVSPKPPSSNMATTKHLHETDLFMELAQATKPERARCIKVVVFDEHDLLWADDFMTRHSWERLYLSVGTDVPDLNEPLDVTRQKICDRYRWLCEHANKLHHDVTVLPQLHVLAYGHARGV